MSANVEAMVREGINAFKAGRKDESRALLSKAVELDPYNEDGWLWLSGVVTSADDQRTCLENVLAINPDNSRARSGLDFLIRQNPTASPPPAPVPPPAAASGAPSMPGAYGASATETSIEWGEIESEPLDNSGWHAATPPPNESYDDWVSGLQLSTAMPTAAPPAADPFASTPSSSSPFFDDDLPDAGDGASLFGDDDPFSGVAPAATGVGAISFRPPPPASETKAADAPDSAAAPASTAALSAAALGEISIGDEEIALTDEEISLFPEIPKEIKATRMPGTKEHGPLLLKIAVIVLVPLNIAAAVLFFWQVL